MTYVSTVISGNVKPDKKKYSKFFTLENFRQYDNSVMPSSFVGQLFLLYTVKVNNTIILEFDPCSFGQRFWTVGQLRLVLNSRDLSYISIYGQLT